MSTLFYPPIGGGGCGAWKDPVAASANLPATGNSDGDVRLVLDTGFLFTWKGSAWEVAADAGCFFNALGYGLKGDGITDDTAALQALVTRVKNAGGGIIYFPKGTYILTGQINFGAGNAIHVVGEGRDLTILSSTGYTAGSLFYNLGQYSSIEELKFYSAAVENPYVNNCIDTMGAYGLVRNVVIEGLDASHGYSMGILNVGDYVHLLDVRLKNGVLKLYCNGTDWFVI